MQILPNFGHISEFAGGFNGTCGQTALEVCTAVIDQRAPAQTHMVDITHDMIKHGLCSANGASTIDGLATYAGIMGYKIALKWSYSEPFNQDWHTLLLQYAGVNPIIIEIANGGALVNQETGAHDEKGLQYHYIAVGGKQDDGYICADGDNPEVGTKNQVYSYGTLQAARPCGLIMFEYAKGSTMQIPQGWTDDGTTLTAPNKFQLMQGFRDYVLNNPYFVAIAGWPITGFKTSNNIYVVVFQSAALSWDGNKLAPFAIGEYFQTQITNAETEIANLNDQIKQLQQQPPVDNNAATALVTALKAALA